MPRVVSIKEPSALHGNVTAYRGADYVEAADAAAELAAFDRMGPLTQRALNMLPAKFIAADLLRQARLLGIDPKSPYIDQSIAQTIAGRARELIAGDAAPGEVNRRSYEFVRRPRMRTSP